MAPHLCTQDEEYEVQLRSYQQQYEQLRSAFEREQAKMDVSARSRKREKELTSQVRQTIESQHGSFKPSAHMKYE